MPKGTNLTPKTNVIKSAPHACNNCKHVGKLMSNKAPMVVRPCNMCKSEQVVVKDDKGKITNTYFVATRKQVV